MNGHANGTYTNGVATKSRARKSVKTPELLNILETVLLRPIPVVLAIAKGCWNVLVCLMIVSFVVMVAMYRVLFVIGVNTIAFKSWILRNSGLGKMRAQRFRR
jgi:hypothetical protein